MAAFKAALLFIVFCALNCANGQHNCLATCRTVCDGQVPDGPSNLSRGKKGPKGEKGNTGMPGQKGETNKHVVSKHASKLERLETTVGRQSALIEENSLLIENHQRIVDQQSLLIEKQSLLLRKSSLAVENQSLIIKHQSDALKENSALIDELSSCEVAPIENSSNNVTSMSRPTNSSSALLRHNKTTLLRHGDAVEYQCEAGYIPTGAAVRRCQRGKLDPYFSIEPFSCVEICSQTPCEKNGKCISNLDVEDYYTCLCDLPFFGKNCEKEHCKDTEPCLNGGSCQSIAGGTGYKCTCLPKFYGDNCQFEYCKDTNPCLNGGTCTTNDELYECTCVYGYGGPNCEIDNCFRFEIPSSTVDYYDAKNICINLGGEIVSRLLGNDGLNYHSEIWRVVNSVNYSFWIGIVDGESEGTWKFTNGEPATNIIFSWSHGEPNNNGNQDCAYFLRRSRNLDDVRCTVHTCSVLCQLPNNRC